ncbi:MAG: DUF1622 domain-containing protein [Gloeocapsa sp. DLM2.Bin57]|nr:MAG: DUF1622 domain-containing protein [Gloeocapsa sp. DLM2.Bin57]
MEHFFLHGLEGLEASLFLLVRLIKLFLEAIAVFCVFYGLLKTLHTAWQFRRRYHGEIPLIQLRICFGVWLAFALEFQLGSDILATTIAPSFDSLLKLAIISVIRTFLNYFLNQELEKQLEMNKNR